MAGLGKSLNTILADSQRGNAHPIVSAVQFAHLAETGGGATMNAHSGRVLAPGNPGYVVGGMKNDKGEHIAEGVTPGHHVGIDQVLQQRSRVRQQTKGVPSANVGAWQTERAGKKITTWDGSQTMRHRGTAVKTGKARGEDAIWDNGNMAEIVTKRKK